MYILLILYLKMPLPLTPTPLNRIFSIQQYLGLRKHLSATSDFFLKQSIEEMNVHSKIQKKLYSFFPPARVGSFLRVKNKSKNRQKIAKQQIQKGCKLLGRIFLVFFHPPQISNKYLVNRRMVGQMMHEWMDRQMDRQMEKELILI